MIKNDQQLGTPFVNYTDTKSAIEALSGVRVGATAVATDNPTAPFGVYINTGWHWYTTGSVGGTSDHNSLTGLQGGTGSQYYHLGHEEWGSLVTGSITYLHEHSAVAIVTGTIDTARLGSGTANSTTFLRGDQTWGNPSTVTDGAFIYNTANVSIPNNSETALTFAHERYDNGGLHSTGTSTSRITIATGGIYIITGAMEFDANAAGSRYAALKLGGSTYLAVVRGVSDAAGYFAANLSQVVDLVAGDYIELYVYQASGGNLNVLAFGRQPFLSVQRMRA